VCVELNEVKQIARIVYTCLFLLQLSIYSGDHELLVLATINLRSVLLSSIECMLLTPSTAAVIQLVLIGIQQIFVSSTQLSRGILINRLVS
jgi:hypothetical protein